MSPLYKEERRARAVSSPLPPPPPFVKKHVNEERKEIEVGGGVFEGAKTSSFLLQLDFKRGKNLFLPRFFFFIFILIFPPSSFVRALSVFSFHFLALHQSSFEYSRRLEASLLWGRKAESGLRGRRNEGGRASKEGGRASNEGILFPLFFTLLVEHYICLFFTSKPPRWIADGFS